VNQRTLTAGVAGLSITAAVAIGAVGAGAQTAASSKAVVVKETYSLKMVANRYVQDGMRFDRDVYTVASGGTVQFRMTATQEGPHTLTVVTKKDLPKTGQQAFNCRTCAKYFKAHGVDPNNPGPPKFQFLENGVGQNTPPKIDRPGDSAILPPVKGATVKLKVTARKGTTLNFLCLLHPWMQAKLKVV
jgi:plastocyanin